MISNLIKKPFEIILDPNGGGGRAKPVANGRFYVGEIDKDPVANPRTDIAYKDESGQERPLTSPLTLNNSGAFVVSENDGTIIQPYMKLGLGFSTLIKDSRGRDVYSNLNAGDPGNIVDALAEFTANTETIGSLKDLNPTNIKAAFLTGEDSGLFKFSNEDLSGFVSQDINDSVWIAPNSDPTGSSGAWERQSGQIYKDLSFTLSGSIDTLKKAVNYFSKFFPATSDTVIDVTTPAGYVQDEQILIYGKNLSFVRFGSTDSAVSVNAAVWDGPITEVGYTPCISIKNGAIAHFDIVFDAGETVTSDQSKAGYIVRTGAKLISSGTEDLHIGFKNLNGRGCYIVQNAIAQVNYGDFSNCFQGLRASNQGFAQVRWGDVSNCKSFGLMCDSSYINASSIKGDDCDSFAISTNNGNLMCINAVARRTSTNSVQVVDNGNLVATDSDLSNGAPALIATGGDLSANGVNLSGTTGDAIDARTGAKVSIPSSNLSGSGVGVRARFGASVDATGANGSGCGTGIICDNSEVYANSVDETGADFSGCGTGVFATNSGVIRCDSINVSGATNTGINSGDGAQIFAAKC